MWCEISTRLLVWSLNRCVTRLSFTCVCPVKGSEYSRLQHLPSHSRSHNMHSLLISEFFVFQFLHQYGGNINAEAPTPITPPCSYDSGRVPDKSVRMSCIRIPCDCAFVVTRLCLYTYCDLNMVGGPVVLLSKEQ